MLLPVSSIELRAFLRKPSAKRSRRCANSNTCIVPFLPGGILSEKDKSKLGLIPCVSAHLTKFFVALLLPPCSNASLTLERTRSSAWANAGLKFLSAELSARIC